MKIIALLAMLAITLFAASGMLPEDSVGGALTLALIYLIAAAVFGLYEAWSAKRGVVGWIVSLITAVVGGLLGASTGSFFIEMMLVLLQFEGSLADTHHPLFYVSLNAQMIFTLLGSWLALQIVNRMR